LAAGLTDPDTSRCATHLQPGEVQKPARGGETRSLTNMPAIEKMDEIDDADLTQSSGALHAETLAPGERCHP